MDFEEMTEEQLKEVAEKEDKLDKFKLYKGEDRVVLIEEALKAIKAMPERERLDINLSVINKHLDGFRVGELAIVSGPTGMGKTTLLQSFTYDFAEKGIKSAWFSYEVGVRDLVKRFGDDVPTFALPLKTYDSNFEWLEEKIWEAKAKYDVKTIFIDHLHYLLDMNELAKYNTSLAIGKLMRSLKKLAIETDTLIFLVSHLSKTKLEAEPDLDDIRDSSFIGQESDVVLVIYRNKNTHGEYDRTWLKIAKNRRVGNLGKTEISLISGRFCEAV